MRLFSVVAIASVALSAIAQGACVDADPADFWNAQELFRTPRFRANPYPESDYPGMRAMLVEGRGPGGTNAEFFAYFAKPEGAMPKGGFPGLLLVHGGGGTAFPTYVAEFVKDGFAVLALDWYNQRPAPALTNVPPREGTTPRVPLAGGKRQNHVANVANMVLAHSLLRSFPEVDASRTVYVGLSWGSWYGSCVTAVDNRFKGACMIYLCDRHPDATADPNSGKFVRGPFHKSMRVPSWWIVWPRDSNGLPSTMQAGWEACPCEAGRTIVHNLGHSHEGFSVAAVHRMARFFAGEDVRVPRLSLGRRDGRTVSAEIVDAGKGVTEALLWYTERPPLGISELTKNAKTEWRSAPAKIEGTAVSATLPEGARIAYLSVYEAKQSDSRRRVFSGSSGFFHIGNVAPFRDGETVVFLGDSITHGGRYVADLQLYWLLRHPGSDVKLHNAGVCGQRANHGLIRYDWDVAPLKPDRVFILFGMNDVARDGRWAPPDTSEKLKRRADLTHTYVTNLTALVRKVRASGAVPVVMTPTPFDQYSDIPKTDRCPGTDDPGLKSFAAKAREVAASEGVECVELYEELLPILKANPEKVFLKDRVHPGYEGHLLMAALILKAMGEDGAADVTAFDASSGARRFTYAPKRLPYPTCAEYAVADSVMPLTEGWNRETVRIMGLPEGRWTLRLGGMDFGAYSAAALAAGVNLTVTNETRFSPSLKAAKRAWTEMTAFHSEQSALRVLAQTFCQVRRLGGDINSLDSCLEKYNEWIEVYRQKPETMRYYTYYGNQIPAFKKKYLDRENALKRIEKHRAAMAAMRAESYEISVECHPSDAVDNDAAAAVW